MDLPVLQTIRFFSRERTHSFAGESMLAQEWTHPHGQYAGVGVRPSFLAYGQRGSACCHGTDRERDGLGEPPPSPRCWLCSVMGTKLVKISNDKQFQKIVTMLFFCYLISTENHYIYSSIKRPAKTVTHWYKLHLLTTLYMSWLLRNLWHTVR